MLQQQSDFVSSSIKHVSSSTDKIKSLALLTCLILPKTDYHLLYTQCDIKQ